MKRTVTVKNARNKKYREILEKITKDKVCPFCAENLKKYHTRPILKNGRFWTVTENMHPYAGSRHHYLLILKRHVESIETLSSAEWGELKQHHQFLVRKKKISGGTLLIRSGNHHYTGGSVVHLHAQLISGNGKKSVMSRVG